MKTSDAATHSRASASPAAAQMPRKPMIVTPFGVIRLRSTSQSTARETLDLRRGAASSS
jgi:hypothetical protein